MHLSVHPDGKVMVTVPTVFNQKKVDLFVEKYAHWIAKKIKQIKSRNIIWGEKKLIPIYKKQARVFVEERCAYFGKLYGVKPEKISIRGQKSRWGSCSRKGNLNFNYQIIFLPPQLADQVIVHELCHLIEFNHSKRFWDLVGKAIPDYVAVRKELRKTNIYMK